MKKYARRRAFTLVELLLVIIIIAVLAGMMMISSDEASISARAATIISDMENIKAAAAAYYLDHYREIETKGWKGLNPRDDDLNKIDAATTTIWGYLHNADTKQREAGKFYEDDDGDIHYQNYDEGGFDYKYSLGGDYGTHWFVWCYVPDKRVMDKQDGVESKNGIGNNRHHSTESKDLTDDYGFVGICIH